MDEAVKTGILSKRWEYLWTNVGTLVFISSINSNTKQKEQFIDFVYRTLSLYETNTIEKFYLQCDLFDHVASQHTSQEDKHKLMVFASHVDVWIRFAVRRKVEKLYLNVSHEEDNDDDTIRDIHHYKLPHYLFTNDSIRELSLEYCIIDPPQPILWNNLKILTLWEISSSDNLIQNILSGTPLLEELSLIYCMDVKNVDITSRNLKTLDINLKFESKLKITAPYVQKMVIRGDIAGYTLTNVLSLVNVRVVSRLDHSDDNALKKLLESVRHAQYLSLDSDCLQVLSMLEVQNLHLSSLNCNTLLLLTNLTKWELPGIVAMLRASPNFQMLILKDDNTFDNLDYEDVFTEIYDFIEENYWSSQLQRDWLLATLTTVKIYDFKYSSSETGLVEFILKKAHKLLTINLVCKEKEDFSKDKAVTKDMLNFSQKLLSIRKASPDAVVHFS